MTDREKEEYELAKRIGDKRFGSPCEHGKTNSAGCLLCLRKTWGQADLVYSIRRK